MRKQSKQDLITGIPRAEYVHEYYLKNKEKIAERKKAWYENNKSRIAAQQKDYRERMKEAA